MSIICKKDVKPSVVNVTRQYTIDKIMKIKLATEWRLCSDLSTNKSLNLTIGYYS